jgi:hypothetical protein
MTMSSFEDLASRRVMMDARRCAVLVDAILDIDAVRQKLTDAGLNHSAYLLDIAKLDLIASLYRVPEDKLSPLAKQLFVKTASQSTATHELADSN